MCKMFRLAQRVGGLDHPHPPRVIVIVFMVKRRRPIRGRLARHEIAPAVRERRGDADDVGDRGELPLGRVLQGGGSAEGVGLVPEFRATRGTRGTTKASSLQGCNGKSPAALVDHRSTRTPRVRCWPWPAASVKCFARLTITRIERKRTFKVRLRLRKIAAFSEKLPIPTIRDCI
jgi:hypothetical protein